MIDKITEYDEDNDLFENFGETRQLDEDEYYYQPYSEEYKEEE